MVETYKGSLDTKRIKQQPTPRKSTKPSNSVHSVHESKPIKPKSSLSSGKMSKDGGVDFVRRNHSGSQWARIVLHNSAVNNYKKKVFSLDEHTNELSSRNKVKNSLVVKSSVAQSTQKPTTNSKQLINSAAKGS